MSRSIIVYTPTALDLEMMSNQCVHIGEVSTLEPGFFWIQSDNEYLRLEISEEILLELEDFELSALEAIMPNPNFAYVALNNIDMVNAFLPILAGIPGCIVENGSGTTLPAAEFMKLSLQGVSWYDLEEDAVPPEFHALMPWSDRSQPDEQ